MYASDDDVRDQSQSTGTRQDEEPAGALDSTEGKF